eukprot:TRINITY_DN518_c0_g1_i2.p1 TRINITY_DN518_c0_g1~~TRINITY_DN518_c0_g1_i2.p1  ORF type:complete len:174 (+),score=12.13 TRINITY_DN518_c0_g1_i2:102-623(+)
MIVENRPKNTETVSSLQRKAVSNVSSVNKRLQRIELPIILRWMRVVNVLNAVLIVLSVIYAYQKINEKDSEYLGEDDEEWSVYTCMVYSCVFSLALIALEINLNSRKFGMRKLFGFLFSFSGRMLFLLFMSSLAFAFSKDIITYCVAGFTLSNFFWMLYTLSTHPGFGGLSNV